MSPFARPRRLYWIALLLLAPLAPVAADDPPRFNLAEARKSVVLVRRITPGLPPATGTGFLVGRAGLVYTARHVAVSPDEAVKGTILLVGVPSARDPDVLDYYKAEVAHAPDAKSALDFAVLKIAGQGGATAFKSLPLAAGKLGLGDDVAVLGYPVVSGDQPGLSFNKGSVSNARVRLGDRSHYQTDAAVNPGNSGGPLLNARGEVAGVVTLRQKGANSIGFALHLDEVRGAVGAAEKAAAALTPVPGPLDPKALPVLAGITANRKSWDIGKGVAREEKNTLVLDDDGGTYWLTSKETLPADFQLVVPCQIDFLKGRQVIQPSQRNILRMLSVRFGTEETKADILEPKGNLIQFTHAHLLLWKDGVVQKREVKGNPEDPFVLTVTKQGGEYSVAVNGEFLLRHSDDRPLRAGTKFSIGGYLSRLYLGDVTVIDLTANTPKK